MRSALRLRRVTARLAAVFITVGLVSVATVQPARADRCATPAHVYLIRLGPLPSFTSPPEIFSSGNNGDESNPPTGTFQRGLSTVSLAGNGLEPGTVIQWGMFNVATGHDVGVRPMSGQAARDNCVVHQEYPTYLVTAPPGTYELRASFYGGNTGVFYLSRLVMRMVVNQHFSNSSTTFNQTTDEGDYGLVENTGGGGGGGGGGGDGGGGGGGCESGQICEIQY